MTNKIVILDDSVILYEHYISDDKWERTLAFPRGGLTYLVSNGTVKFYAYEDYFYRNCLISMQLPIYIVDEFMHIDGEYDNIKDLTEVLDRIFPTNDMDAQLEKYLKIVDAELLYQPIGDYALKSDIPDIGDFVTTEELVEALDDYYTKEESDAKYQLKGDYATKDELDLKADKDDVYTKTESDNKYQSKGDYATKNELSLKANKGDVYTKTESDNKYQPKGDYLTSADTYVKDEIDDKLDDKLDASAYTPCDLSNYYTKQETSSKTQIDTALAKKADNSKVYTKTESDRKYQPKGDYVDESVYDAFTATTITEIDNLNINKLDASAYTPCDLSNYYTKQEVYNKNETYSRNEIDDKIVEAGGFDPTKYYTKTVSDSRFALKNEIPSLSGYATEDWVLSKNYATRADFITYINNMQTQINSLIEAVSGCCETQEDVYRWLTIIGEYLCEDNNKYEKQKYQVSHDGGIVWEDVTPMQYRKGELLETDSPDCGYVPDPQYRWKAAPTSDYLCSGTSKYYKVYYEVSYDGGQTWQHAVPEQTKRGDLIEAQSTDCGYIAPQYRWYTSQSEYICSGTTKYEKQYYQVSNDNGKTWQNVTPVKTRSGSVIEYNSEDCGYVPPTPQYRWKDTSSKTCSGNNKYYVAVKQVSYDEGKTWQNVTPTETQMGTLYQAYSYSCGYVGTPKLKLYNDNGEANQLNCESSTSSTLTSAEYWDVYDNFNGDACSQGLHIEIGDCVTQIGDLLSGRTILFAPCAKTIDYGKNVTTVTDGNGSAENCSGLTAVTLPANITELNVSFKNCTSLKNMTIPSKVSIIRTGIWQNCSSLESLTFLSVTPPDLGEYYAITFQNTNNCILYVPSQSLNAYKTANGWKEYASRIMPINS